MRSPFYDWAILRTRRGLRSLGYLFAHYLPDVAFCVRVSFELDAMKLGGRQVTVGK